MRRPRRAAVGVLSPWRASKLGKIRRRACLCLIPLPGTGDVLLVPTMISHPLAYVAPTTRHFHRWPCHPSILTHTSFYSPVTATSHRSRSSQPTYSPPLGHPLLHLPWPRVVPFLGLAVVHRRGALGAAWSMWSTTDFHRKSTVRGEADSWVHGRIKEVPPYYAQNNYSST